MRAIGNGGVANDRPPTRAASSEERAEHFASLSDGVGVAFSVMFRAFSTSQVISTPP